MRLERLEINGFKSFSDRSELAFDKGVTAIVGPNGCGKSNVADAITWVMGEQSAKSLRGDRMEDVIFNGSDARKPTAAAEVRLRFSGVVKGLMEGPAPANGNGSHANGNGNGNGHSNGHGHHVDAVADLADADEILQSVAREVEVTRRLYRSGESEYLIDGQICRLRDIHDLLMDTGLGAKAYAIIEQGKIGMILSTRPTDRRQLIEEAAGVTKYKARRRSAELKLEAARQNLTRVDDIVFEVEKQLGALKRQAGKAKRYQRLRDELRRWEKVLFARKYRQLADAIESARTRLGAARERELAASARVAAVESDLGRFRIEHGEAESRATSVREAAHALELEISRRQQQIHFDKEQVLGLTVRASSISAEIDNLNARREPARLALLSRRETAGAAVEERDRAAATLASEIDAYETRRREIEGLEGDVEAARSEVFSAINAATALRHSLEHGAVARDKVGEALSKLHVEAEDVRIETERVETDQQSAADGWRQAQAAIDATRTARSARESELASARIEHEWRARSVRAREHEIAGLEARLQSLRELEAARSGYGDAARAVLVQANGKVSQQGAVADFLEVEAGYERAVEGCLSDLLQHIVVEQPEHAAAGIQLVREQGAGRCGFLIAGESPAEAGHYTGHNLAEAGHDTGHDLAEAGLDIGHNLAEVGHDTGHDTGTDQLDGGSGQPVVSGFSQTSPSGAAIPEGLVALSSVVRVTGRYAPSIRQAMGDAWIARNYELASAASQSAGVGVLVATIDGDVFRGPRQVSGGGGDEARGILETKREIKDLERRLDVERQGLFHLAEETTGLEVTIAQASNTIAALNAEHHKQEKVIVALEGQMQRATEEAARVEQKREQLARERRQSEDERDTLDRRQAEARQSILELEQGQRWAEERLTQAQRCLLEARELAEEFGRRTADAGANHAALIERAAALTLEVQRLEETFGELEGRATSLAAESGETFERIGALNRAIVDGEATLDADVRTLEALKGELLAADEAVSGLRAQIEEQETALKTARREFEAIRTIAIELDIARVTAESDLSHLANSCLEAVQCSLDGVLEEVAELEQAGDLTPDARVIYAEEPSDDGEADGASRPTLAETVNHVMTAEDAISALRAKIDRLGPVNMMAIEQFDELGTRQVFLTTQRKDLVESIAQTAEVIKRIDETTRQRFTEAFAAINLNFQLMFSTLFGGGRAGLALLDENDPLESGIEIIASPPGKRLQSVQLLSGGEKALTAISLMFALFKYKPSPFCLLDEIDAPLDDANIGRFVEMLRGMQTNTQFILITHNRKTMEIADRLYGVTMEEPGVSKLISVQLN